MRDAEHCFSRFPPKKYRSNAANLTPYPCILKEAVNRCDLGHQNPRKVRVAADLTSPQLKQIALGLESMNPALRKGGSSERRKKLVTGY